MDGNAMYSKEAVEYMWKAAIPLQIHLDESEVTTFPAPPPAFVLLPLDHHLHHHSLCCIFVS